MNASYDFYHAKKQIYEDVTQALGEVPTVRLNRLSDECRMHQLYLRLESCNPGGSIKDKNAVYLVNWAEASGQLRAGGTIVESSSGNFGLGLAMVGAARGYRVIIVVDSKTQPPIRRMLSAYGAELVDVPSHFADANGSLQLARMKRAKELANSIPGAWYPCQHTNPVNPEAHLHTTANEIERLFGGDLHAILVGVSTAGQISGIARHYKSLYPQVQIIGVDVLGSAAFGGSSQSYKMTGVGLSFAPPNLDRALVDQCFVVHEEVGYSVCHALARKEGLFLGASTGLIVAAGLRVAQGMRRGSRLLMVNPDRGERYIDTVYSPDWLKANHFRSLQDQELQHLITQLKPIDHEHSEATIS